MNAKDERWKRCFEECGSAVNGWCQQERLPTGCLKSDAERKKLIWYSARLTLALHGCGSANCPISPKRKAMIGTANICRCRDEVNGLLDAIRAHPYIAAETMEESK